MDHATVNLARSKDGLTNWEKSISNPIVAPGSEGSWNCDAVYKPFVLRDNVNGRWLLWYNGRCGEVESIGISSLKGNNFGKFVKRAAPAKELWF